VKSLVSEAIQIREFLDSDCVGGVEQFSENWRMGLHFEMANLEDFENIEILASRLRQSPGVKSVRMGKSQQFQCARVDRGVLYLESSLSKSTSSNGYCSRRGTAKERYSGLIVALAVHPQFAPFGTFV
jgi:hypothetical protein